MFRLEKGATIINAEKNILIKINICRNLTNLKFYEMHDFL